MAKDRLHTAAGRRALVTELMAVQGHDGRSVGMIDSLTRLCRAAVHNLEAVGVAVGLMTEGTSFGVVAGADDHSIILEEMQYSLGEGPGHDAFALRRPILTSDLSSRGGDQWPGYRSAALNAGVAGVFAFPLQIGAITFGVITVYAGHPGALGTRELTMALTFAELATEILLDGDSSLELGQVHPGLETALGHHAEIYQAQGVVMVDLGVNLGEALVRMRAHAYSNERTLAELAHDIMAGDVVLGAED